MIITSIFILNNCFADTPAHNCQEKFNALEGERVFLILCELNPQRDSENNEISRGDSCKLAYLDFERRYKKTQEQCKSFFDRNPCIQINSCSL